MRIFAFVMTFLFSTYAYADVIKCSFTEPFIDFSYDTDSRIMRIVGDGVDETMKDISIEFTGVNTFNLVNKNKDAVANLVINFEGNNGMAPVIYPFEVRFHYQFEYIIWGGCESKKLRAIMPRD